MHLLVHSLVMAAMNVQIHSSSSIHQLRVPYHRKDPLHNGGFRASKKWADLNSSGSTQERGVTTLQNSRGTDMGMRDRLYTQKRALEGGRSVQGPTPASSLPSRSEALQTRNMNGTKRSPANTTPCSD